MSDLTPLNEDEIKQFVKDWYVKLDVHAPMVELLPLLLDDGLEMRFPEVTVYGYAGFEGWYQRVIRLFFDEVHEVTKCEVKMSDGQAEIDIIVKWQASVWNPPAAKSERIVLDAYQTWIVKRSPETQKLVVMTYIVDQIKYYEGSATL